VRNPSSQAMRRVRSTPSLQSGQWSREPLAEAVSISSDRRRRSRRLRRLNGNQQYIIVRTCSMPRQRRLCGNWFVGCGSSSRMAPDCFAQKQDVGQLAAARNCPLAVIVDHAETGEIGPVRVGTYRLRSLCG